MAKKVYGETSIGKLRSEGYSPRAIEDIVFIADKYSVRPTKVAKGFEEGYNIAQLDEIYSASKRFSNCFPLKDIKNFYDTFKPEKGSLIGCLERTEYIGDDLFDESELSSLSAMRMVSFLGKNYSIGLDEAISKYYDRLESISKNRVNGHNLNETRELHKSEFDPNNPEHDGSYSIDPKTGARI